MRPMHGALAIALAAAITTSGRADVIYEWTDTFHFHWTVTQLPDVDQRRFGLPNNGSWYCGPTAAFNLFAYFANHGLESLPPGPGNYQSDDFHDDVTDVLADIGTAMSITTPGGVTGEGLEAGIEAWLPDGLFSIVHQYGSHTYTPGFGTINTAVANGAYVIVGVGYYEDFGDHLDRKGGHVVTAARGIVNGGAYGIGFRDPWTMDSLFDQSPFLTNLYITVPETQVPFDGALPRPMWRVYGMEASSGAWHGYIDGVLAIYPTFALTTFGGATVGLVRSNVVEGGEPSLLESFAPVGDGELIDMTMHADLTCAVTILIPLGADGQEVWTMKPQGNGVWEHLDVDVFNPGDPVVNRHRELYLIDGLGTINLVNMDEDPPSVEMIGSSPVPGQALAYDEANDRLLVYSAQEGKLMELDRSLVGPATTHTLPGIPFADDGFVRWNPITGDRWFCVEGQLFRMTEDGAHFEPVIVDVVNPQAIDFGEDGRLFVSDQGVIMEFVEDDGVWDYPPDPVFPPGQPAGQFLHVSRSSTNFDPALHADFVNVVPDPPSGVPVADCVADVNGDGDVGLQDLLIILSVWESDDALADVNADLTVDLQDLLAVLSAWGPCPEAVLP